MDVSKELRFTADDLEGIAYTLKTIEEELYDLIKAINSSQSLTDQNYTQILQLLNNLQQNSLSLNENSSVSELFTAYKKIQQISFQLRSLLKQRGMRGIDTYFNIDYAVYVDGKRYYSTDVKKEWVKSDKNNNLILNLDTMTKELDKQLATQAQKKAQAALAAHYAAYLGAISNMYRGENKLGTIKARLNRGHVAEAFERHLAQHHSGIYQLYLKSENFNNLTSLKYLPSELNQMAKYPTAEDWSSHEHSGADGAWWHIRMSLGNQRGTVAGDVLNTQVKQAIHYEGDNHALTKSLSSLKNLQNGLNIYSKILGVHSEKDIRQIAHELALYLANVLDAETRNAVAQGMNENFKGTLSNFAKKKQIKIM